MKVIDIVNKTELDLTVEQLIDLVANHNRQVDLVYAEKRTDEDGYLSWDQENWTCVDGKRFIRSYFLQGRALSDYSGYNKYDMKGCFLPEEAREVLAEYRDILDAAPRDGESLRRDLGGPVEAMRLVSQPKLYHRWLAAFAVMAACLLLPAAAPLPGGWRLWGFFQQFLYRFPVELMLLAAGLGVSLVWFRRREAGKEGPLPRGVTPLLALQLAGMAVAWSVLYLAAVQPQGPMDFLQAHAGLAGHIADILLWMGFLLSLTGLWALVQARLADRRWRAVYALSLTMTALVMAALSVLWDMRLDGSPADSLPYCALLTVLGLAGTGVSLC